MEDDFSPINMDSVKYPGSVTDVFDGKKTNRRRTVRKTLQMCQTSAVMKTVIEQVPSKSPSLPLTTTTGT